MPRFQVGETAIVTNKVAPCFTAYIGTEVTVIEHWPWGMTDEEYAYMVRCVDGLELGAAERHLRKPDDDVKDKKLHEQPIWVPGQQSAASWDRCVWRPRETVKET